MSFQDQPPITPPLFTCPSAEQLFLLAVLTLAMVFLIVVLAGEEKKKRKKCRGVRHMDEEGSAVFQMNSREETKLDQEIMQLRHDYLRGCHRRRRRQRIRRRRK